MAGGREVRALVRARLPYFVEYLTHGYWPSRGEVVVRGSSPGSRPPAPTWVFDLSIAFGNLNPATANPPWGQLAWVAHRPFNEQQTVLWLYYGTLPGERVVDTSRADRAFWQHERERELTEAVTRWQRLRDAAVARHLHLSTWKAREVRRGGVYQLASQLLARWAAPDGAGKHG